ncbi:type VII secretion integral membrane protein EccD [Thermostaphylospora chromogena]|uniref:Type VII secretion integral membrane protein EccD n=1 Tax=Thermostaphylospora chromogena TaxID=35622 RepID=A0A1H1ATQ5_9ACTN|nr:type VII secretion integral membrane protein EccD [Thermostaphylospora chromogena]SDQ43049.1 type VII secretion integral membrane protein EccD [Thermostaphylospora chromogena]
MTVNSLVHAPIQQGALPQVAAPMPPMCRVTIVAPRKKVDLAVPTDIPLPHVMPALLRAVGEAGGEFATGPGWVLQRLGGPPLDLGLSLGALGILDGEILYLRPREMAMPPALYDDVADLVATGVKEAGGTWSGQHTRNLGTGTAAVLLVLGAVILALSGVPQPLPTVIGGVLAVLLVIAGTALSRAVGDSAAGALVGYTALPYAFVAGFFAVGIGSGLVVLGAPAILAGLACTALVATLGGALIADGVPGFLGTAVASVAGAIASAAVMVFDVPAAGAAALTVTILLSLSPLVPTLSFRMARVPLPPLPTNAEELRADTQRLDTESVLERTAQARRFATGLVIGVALVALGAEVLLAAADGWVPTTMAIVLGAALIMRARVFQGVGQRLWLILTGMTGLVLVALNGNLGAGTVAVVAMAIGLLWAAMILIGLGLWLPNGRPSPFWGRAGDILDLLLIVALTPLALGVLDLYAWVRGLAG